MSYRKLATHPLHARLRSAFTRAAAGALGAAAPLAVLANPTGGQVVGGTATIGSAGANGVVVTQGSQKAIINWQQFSVGSGEYVQFVQPNSSAVVLNRVTGSNPSSIFGDIIANGQVFLVNPNGVYFAPGASIDVQGLLASTLDLNDSDFMQGRYVFSKAPGAPDAGVVNAGGIHAGRGGYVVLAGDYANNSGAIVAQTGRVYLAAGGAATLTFDSNDLISYVVDGKTLSRLAGVTNTGQIAANGGAVVMTADVADTLTATAVNNSGLITAHSVTEHGGEIVLLAQGGDIQNSGTLDASADVSGVTGGVVIVRGDGHTQLDPTSVIDAQGDQAQGGFIELSGHTLSMRGEVTAGRGGSILIDPAIINIISGTSIGANTVSGSVGTGYIASQLSAGVNVTLVAGQKIQKTTGTAIIATGTGNLALKIGTLTAGAGTLGGAACAVKGVCVSGSSEVFTKAAGGTINLSGLTISIGGTFTASATAGAVTTGVITAKSINISGSTLNLGALTTWGASGVVLNAGQGSIIMTSAANINATGGGVVTLTGGNVSLGSVSAGGKLTITVKHGPPTAAVLTVATGKVLTGRSVSISASGSYGGKITAHDIRATSGNISIIDHAGGATPSASAAVAVGNLTAAFGNISITDTGVKGRITTGFIHDVSHSVALSATETGAGGNISIGSVQAFALNVATTTPTGGVININGAVTLNGSLSLAGHTSVADVVGNITARSVTITNTATVGGGNIRLLNVTATGGNINLTNSAHFGSVNVGNLKASNGGIGIQATATSGSASIHAGSATAKTILLHTNAPSRANISASGALKATGAFSTGSNKGMGIVINANNTGGASVSGGNVKLTASGSHAIQATAGGVRIRTLGGLDSGAHIIVNGGIVATGLVDILSSDLGTCCGSVSLKNVTGQAVHIKLVGAGSRNTLKTGAVTATGTKSSGSVQDDVQITDSAAIAPGGSISIAGPIKSAHGNIAVNGPSIPITMGSASGATIVVTGNGITAGALTATGALTVAGFAGDGIVLSAGTGAVTMTAAAKMTASHGAIVITGGNMLLGSISAAGKVSAHAHLTGPTGGITVGNSVTGKSVSLIASGSNGGNITAGAITATSSLDIEANGARGTPLGVVQVGDLTAGTALTVKGKSVAMGGVADAAKSGSISATSTLTATAAGNLALTGVALKAGSALHVSAGGNLTMSDVTIAAPAFSASAGGNLVLTTSGTQSLSGMTLRAGKAMTLQAATLNLGNASITAGGAFAASAQGATGLLTAGNGNITATAISLKSGGLVSMSSETLKVNGGGAFTASAGGSLGLTGATLTAGAVTAKAGGVLDLTSAHVNAGGAVTLTAAKHILLGKTVVTAAGAFSADAHGSISDGGSAGSITAAGATFKAGTGKIVLDGETLATGTSKLAFSAAGSVALNGAHIHAGDMTVAAVGNLNMTSASVNAASIQAVTGGSIDLSGDTVVATGAFQLTAGLVAAKQPLAAKDIILSGVNINVGTFAAVAGGTIHNGGTTGTLTAKGLALTAGKDINLSSTQVTVGNASLASLPSDTLLLQALAAAGLSPATPKPNAYFNAGGTLTLGKFTLNGTYLYMQAANIAILGPVSTPADSVIQFAPTTGPDSIGVEQNPGTGSVLNLSNSLLLSLFPGTTLVIGNGVESGAVTLGSNGPFDIGSSNLIVETSGTVTGLNNVTSTGLISTVQSLLASALVPPTPSEIDPNSSNNNNAAGKHDPGDYDPNAGDGGGTISQSTDTGGACH